MKFVFAALIALLIAAFSATEAQADTTLASWYGPGFAGNPTASGEAYDPAGFTAAHKTLPLGTPITVSYGGRSVEVVVNDRGPYVGDRELDLSQGAAEYLGLTAAGVDYVEYSVSGGAAAATTAAPAATGFEDTSGAAQTYTDSQDVGGGLAESSVEMSGSGGQGGSYIVQSGDTLQDISGELGVSMDGLASANGLANPDVLSVGQTLSY